MKLVGERTITAEQISEVVANIQAGKCSKGAGIRELFAGGMEVKEIATATGIRYNHVYNVVKNEVLVNDLEVEKSGRNNENSKKNQIVKMLEEGKSINEISKELKCLYNYVWQVAKGAGFTGKKAVQEETVQAEVVVDEASATAVQDILDEVDKNSGKGKRKEAKMA